MRTNFGRWVEQWTIEAGISQNELARRLGISPIVFCKYCTGGRRISTKTLKEIAEEMNLNVEEKRELYATAITDEELRLAENLLGKDGVTPLDVVISIKFGEQL